MRFISTQTHGIMDYIIGTTLITSPWFFNFYRDGTETWLLFVLGLLSILMNLMTDYQYSMIREISMQVHLIIDFLEGIFLAASPWIFGFYLYVFMPHLVFGIIIVLASVTTISHESASSEIAFNRR